MSVVVIECLYKILIVTYNVTNGESPPVQRCLDGLRRGERAARREDLGVVSPSLLLLRFVSLVVVLPFMNEARRLTLDRRPTALHFS